MASEVADYEKLIALGHPKPEIFGPLICHSALVHLVQDNAHLSRRDWEATYKLLKAFSK